MGIFKPEPTKEEIAAKKRLSALVVANNNEQAKKEKLVKVISDLLDSISDIEDERDLAIKNRDGAIAEQVKEEVKLHGIEDQVRKASEELSGLRNDIRKEISNLGDIEEKREARVTELARTIELIESNKLKALKDITIALEKAKGLF